MDEFYDEPYNEYNDWDATSCACGDYNEFEEREVFNDHEGDWEPDEPEDQYLDSYWEDQYELPEYEF